MTINLSAAAITNKAPYPVHSDNGYTFVFSTNYGVRYGIGFVEDYMLSDDGWVFQIFIDNKDERKTCLYYKIVLHHSKVFMMR